MPELYHVTEPNPDHKVWGIYTRRKRSGYGNLFRLTTFTFDCQTAIQQGQALMEQSTHPIEVSIQGASASHNLPDKYNP